MSEESTFDPAALQATLQGAIADAWDSDAFPNPGGWTFKEVAVQNLMMRDVPVAVFTKDDTSVSFIVVPSEEDAQYFARSAKYDVTYFSEDVGDDEQSEIFGRDQDMIEGFASWIKSWDS